MLNRFDIGKLFLLAAFCAASASAQHLSVGVVGGAPFTDVVNSYNQNNLSFLPKSTNFTIGPSLQINLPLNLRFEFDALYRPYSFLHHGFTPRQLHRVRHRSGASRSCCNTGSTHLS